MLHVGQGAQVTWLVVAGTSIQVVDVVSLGFLPQLPRNEDVLLEFQLMARVQPVIAILLCTTRKGHNPVAATKRSSRSPRPIEQADQMFGSKKQTTLLALVRLVPPHQLDGAL